MPFVFIQYIVHILYIYKYNTWCEIYQLVITIFQSSAQRGKLDKISFTNEYKNILNGVKTKWEDQEARMRL